MDHFPLLIIPTDPHAVEPLNPSALWFSVLRTGSWSLFSSDKSLDIHTVRHLCSCTVWVITASMCYKCLEDTRFSTFPCVLSVLSVTVVCVDRCGLLCSPQLLHHLTTCSYKRPAHPPRCRQIVLSFLVISHCTLVCVCNLSLLLFTVKLTE